MTVIRQSGLPYDGWTLPQFNFWSSRTALAENEKRADEMESMTSSVQAVMSKAGANQLRRFIRILRSTHGGDQTENNDPAGSGAGNIESIPTDQ